MEPPPHYVHDKCRDNHNLKEAKGGNEFEQGKEGRIDLPVKTLRTIMHTRAPSLPPYASPCLLSTAPALRST